MIYAHITEYFSAIKRNEILIHTTIGMNSENLKPSKITSHRRKNIASFYLYEIFGIVKFIETEHRVEVTRGCRGGWKIDLLLNGV